jgi:cell division protein FtsW
MTIQPSNPNAARPGTFDPRFLLRDGLVPRGQRPAVVSARAVDGWLLGAVLALLSLGLLMVYDASYFLVQERYGDGYLLLRRQLTFTLIATGVAAFAMRIDLRSFRHLVYPALGGMVFLLVLVLVPGIGIERGGAHRWLSAGFFAFEPSELLKPVLVLALAHSICRKGPRMRSFADGVVPHLVVAAIPMALLLGQPDFGSAATVLLLTMVLLFIGGARPWHLALPGVAVLPAAAWLVWSSPYRWRRLIGFLEPWKDPLGAGFQLCQSLLAFGNGGVTGVGLGDSNQKLFYLPEGHTDFIFALVGEELGFAGALVVIACYGLITVRGCRIAIRLGDDFSRLVAFGITFILVGQAALNIGVVLGLLPTKGLPLPLMSYGGSSLVTTGLCVGILLRLSREAR